MGRGPEGHFEERIWEARPGGLGGRRDRQPFRYKAFVPALIADWELELGGDAVTALAEATTAVAHLNQFPLQLDSLEALARQLLRAESLASSRIEGLQLSHRRLARAAHDADTAHDAKASDVVGNVRAMERAIEIASEARPFTVADIQLIHETLLRFGMDRPIAGIIRTRQNWIGKNAHSPWGADFVPPPPELVPVRLQDLCAFMNRDDLPPLAQAAVAHAQFETIHPFADGNGRVGRCLVHAVLRRRELSPRYVPPISLVLATRRGQYISGLEAYREGGLDDWCEVFCDATAFASREAERLDADLAALRQRWVERLDTPRQDSSAYAILAALPAYPVLDVGTAARIADVSDVAIGRVLNRMEQAGILRQLDDRRRSRVWECPELFELVNEFEADLATPEGAANAARPTPRRP